MDFGTFIQQPFAAQGDRQEVPFEAQPSNLVSWETGWTIDYTLNIQTDPRAKAIERQKNNYLSWVMSSILSQYQRQGTPEWVGPADNGGNPLGYAVGATVIYGGVYYVSLTANNITEPGVVGSNWQVHARLAATDVQAAAGTSRQLIVTPASLAYVLSQQSGGQPATTTQAGIVRLSTPAEASAGLLNTIATTPAALKPLFDAKMNSASPQWTTPSFATYHLNTAEWSLIQRYSRVNGTTAWDMQYQPVSNQLRWVSYDVNGANPVEQVKFTPGQLAVQGDIAATGRVYGGYGANQSETGTTRYATQAEVSAAGQAGLAISPSTLRAELLASWAPINGPSFRGGVTVSSGQGGFVFRNYTNNLNRYYFDGEVSGGASLELNTCNDSGAAIGPAFSVQRLTRNVNFNTQVAVAGFCLAGTFRATSARWKKNLEGPIKDPLAILSKFKAYSGTWKDDAFPGSEGLGEQWFLVADEAARIQRGLCGFDEETGEADSVNYPGIVPLLIASSQALLEQNEILRNELNELRALITKGN